MTRLDGGGAKLLVLDDGTVEGSLGDPALDERFTAEARDAMARRTSRTAVLEDVRAFVEVFAPRPCCSWWGPATWPCRW